MANKTDYAGPVTEEALCEWIGAARPGDSLCYHVGFLWIDRNRSVSQLDPPVSFALDKVARRSLWASEKGLVHLFQRRLGVGQYEYLIVARPKPPIAGGVLAAMLADALKE